MELKDWIEQPKLAEELAILLANPTLKIALSIVEGMTMAKSMTNDTLLQITNHDILFGVDVGRNASIKDLKDLAVIAKVKKQPETKYREE